MTVKYIFIDDWYWYAKKPIPVWYKTNRFQRIQTGPSVKGAYIGTIDPDVELEIDEAEAYDGWKRIIRIKDVDSYVYPEWLKALDHLVAEPEEQEAWIDQTALTKLPNPAEPIDDPIPPDLPVTPEIIWQFTVFGYTVTITKAVVE